jgi:hypothetical protein
VRELDCSCTALFLRNGEVVYADYIPNVAKVSDRLPGVVLIKALDHAKIGEGPGGPAEMVPGQHHVRMNMYIAQADNGNFKIAKSLGVIDPKECTQGI